MKQNVFLVCLFSVVQSQAAVSMSRVVGIDTSRTITVETNGRRATVTLRGIDIAPGEETAAVEYLHRQLDHAWVYAEEGEVYRSPDGLYINAELQRHAWRASTGMRYLGEVNPGPRPRERALTRRSAAPSPAPGRGISRAPKRRPRSARGG